MGGAGSVHTMGSAAATVMKQGRHLELKGERLVRGKRLARTCDHGRKVVIASQPLQVQFD